MRLKILGDIYFRDIRRSVPVGILEEVSTACLFFAKETCNVARKDLVFADMQTNPDHSEHSFLTPVEACCYHPDDQPWVLIFIRPESCTEITALHEMMHAHVYFAEGYDNPRRFQGHLPFHIKLFVKMIRNLLMDLHVNERLKQRGFSVDSFRKGGYTGLEEQFAYLRRPRYARGVGIQLQVGMGWAHLLAGTHIYAPTADDKEVHRQLDAFCRRHCPGVIRFRDLFTDACRRIGYDTSDKVGRFQDEVIPKIFKMLGERFRREYLQPTDGRRAAAALSRRAALPHYSQL